MMIYRFLFILWYHVIIWLIVCDYFNLFYLFDYCQIICDHFDIISTCLKILETLSASICDYWCDYLRIIRDFGDIFMYFHISCTDLVLLRVYVINMDAFFR